MSAERRSRTPGTPATEAGAARLVALSHDLMGAVDERGRLVWTNPAWERVLGWPPDALGGSFYLDWLHPDDRAGAAEARRALAEGAGEWPEIEVRVRTRAGDHRWVLFSAVLARDERLVYLCGKDVSARNEAVAERALTHARYKALVSNLPDTVITLFDTDLRILVTEGGQLARRGLDPSAYDGMSVPDTVPAEHHDGMERRLRAALTGEPQAFDLETPDGSTIYRTQVVALHDDDDDGAVLGGLMVSRDVTERRLQERALASRAAELERSNAELAQFAYVASHDLSEPLRMVSSYLQLLHRRYHGRLDDDADAFIGYAVDGAARMRTLIEDLLTYSRAGRAERGPEPVDTGGIVAEVAETLRAQAPEAPPDIAWGELPTVPGDPAQLAQLFQNLLGNAVKFVAPGVQPRVRVSAAREPDGWRFAVDDNGVGIEPRHLGRVFGMFQRVHTRADFPGTGIGLAIAKKVVDRHGGEIRAVGLPQGGTRFEFTLAEDPS